MLYKKEEPPRSLIYEKKEQSPPDFAPCNLFPVITNTEKTSLIKKYAFFSFRSYSVRYPTKDVYRRCLHRPAC